MSRDTLLSLGVGVPIAVLALSLLFWVEANRAAGRPTPAVLAAVTALVSAGFFALAVARFVVYA